MAIKRSNKKPKKTSEPIEHQSISYLLDIEKHKTRRSLGIVVAIIACLMVIVLSFLVITPSVAQDLVHYVANWGAVSFGFAVNWVLQQAVRMFKYIVEG